MQISEISEIMTPNVQITNPKESISTVARMMRDGDYGVMPVGENDRLVGMITDRDIVTRGVAESKNPEECTVSDVMSNDLIYCFEDDDVEDISRKMSDEQIRRIPVLNREKRLTGIVSLGDIALNDRNDRLSGETLEQVSEQSDQHSQH